MHAVLSQVSRVFKRYLPTKWLSLRLDDNPQEIADIILASSREISFCCKKNGEYLVLEILSNVTYLIK